MEGKVAIITGATGGIGQAIAPLLSDRGVKLVLAARRSDVLDVMTTELSGSVAVPTDVTHSEQVNALIEKAIAAFGRVDILLNCAGVGILKQAGQLSPNELDTMLDVNLKGSFYASQAASAVMRERKSGHIINFPGTLGKYPMAMAAGYCASKFGVVGFTKCMADELKRFGVKFTLCHFGGVNTPFWDEIALKVQRDKMLQPDTVAAAILYALDAPVGAVPNEIILQPENHQFL
ncbi:MAG: SDR family oxidoreductase [Cyanobacteria bacterium P01_D01_bin.123]